MIVRTAARQQATCPRIRHAIAGRQAYLHRYAVFTQYFLPIHGQLHRPRVDLPDDRVRAQVSVEAGPQFAPQAAAHEAEAALVFEDRDGRKLCTPQKVQEEGACNCENEFHLKGPPALSGGVSLQGRARDAVSPLDP